MHRYTILKGDFVKKEIPIYFHIEKSNYLLLEYFCKENNISKSEAIRRAIYKYIKSEEPDKEKKIHDQGKKEMCLELIANINHKISLLDSIGEQL